MRSRPVCPVLVLLLALGGLAIAGAAETESLAELRAGLESRFEILELSDRVVLTLPADEPGPRAVEVAGSMIALDGEAVGTDELRARLGAEAAGWVLAFAELDEAARRELLAAPAPAAGIEEVAEAVAGSVAEGVAESVAERVAAAEEAAAAAREKRRSEPRRPRRTGDSEVAFAGSLTVEKDEVTEDVLVVGGVLKVVGRVEGEATVLGGSANIEGVVEGDVTAVGGTVRLESGSWVHGDVTSVGGRVYREDGARVDGEVEQVPLSADLRFGPWTNWKHWRHYGDYGKFEFAPWGWLTGLGWKLFKVLFLAALAWVSLLLARGPIDRMERRIEAEPWKTGLVGLLAQVLFVPAVIMLTVFLAISIVGIPLLLLLPFLLLAVLVVGWLGLVAVAGRVGSWAEGRFGWTLGSPFWVVLVGFVLLASLSLVGQILDFGVAPMRFLAALFGFFGAIVGFAAWTIACGAAVLTRFGTAESWSRAESFTAPLPPLPPLPTTGRPAGGGETAEEAEPEWTDDFPPDEPDAPGEGPREE